MNVNAHQLLVIACRRTDHIAVDVPVGVLTLHRLRFEMTIDQDCALVYCGSPAVTGRAAISDWLKQHVERKQANEEFRSAPADRSQALFGSGAEAFRDRGERPDQNPNGN